MKTMNFKNLKIKQSVKNAWLWAKGVVVKIALYISEINARSKEIHASYFEENNKRGKYSPYGDEHIYLEAIQHNSNEKKLREARIIKPSGHLTAFQSVSPTKTQEKTQTNVRSTDSENTHNNDALLVSSMIVQASASSPSRDSHSSPHAGGSSDSHSSCYSSDSSNSCSD